MRFSNFGVARPRVFGARGLYKGSEYLAETVVVYWVVFMLILVLGVI